MWSILDAFLLFRPKIEPYTKSVLGNPAGSLILNLSKGTTLAALGFFSQSSEQKLREVRLVNYIITQASPVGAQINSRLEPLLS